MKLVVIELWFGSYRTLENLQNSSTLSLSLPINTLSPKKTICLFNKCVDKALNFKQVYFVNT